MLCFASYRKQVLICVSWIINFYSRSCQLCNAKSLLILYIPFCLLNPLKSTSEHLPTDFQCGLSSPTKWAFIRPGLGCPLILMYSGFTIRCQFFSPFNRVISETQISIYFVGSFEVVTCRRLRHINTTQLHLSEAQKPQRTRVDGWLAWWWQHKWDPLGWDEEWF